MDEEKGLGFLGICRRAGALSCGHDAAVEAIVKNRAKAVLLASDASERLVGEITHASRYENREIPVISCRSTMEAFGRRLGIRCAVYAVTDANFATKIITLFGEENDDQ